MSDAAGEAVAARPIYYFRRMHSTKIIRPPGPKGLIGGRQLLAFRRDPLALLLGVARRHGDIAHVKVGPQHFYLLSHPEYVKSVLVTDHENFLKGRGLQRAKRLLGEGLLTSEKELHRRQRRLAQPAFHRQRISGYGAVMVEYAERMQRARWRDGETRDVWDEMMRLTLAIVGKTLFDADVEREAEHVGRALGEMMENFHTFMMPFSELLERLPLPFMRRVREARVSLDAIIYRIIDERRGGAKDRGDLLSMLLLAQDEEGDGGGMSDEQLRDEAMTIFLAGHETTANALTWTWYLLSRHPEVEEKLHREIDAVGEEGRPFGVDDLPRLRYAEMVLTEAMRLYPPAWTLGRQVIEDYEIGGYVIPSGSLVLISQYVVHHDARFFADPFRFDPERWTPEARAARPTYSYFPFGGGVRRCIGEGFAWMEGVLLLATVARRWKLRMAPGHPPVATRAVVTLRPKHGMVMKLEER